MAAKIKVASFELDIDLKRGTAFLKTPIWKTGVKGAEAPVDLTGCTSRMQIRATQTADEVLHEMNTTDGGITLGDSNGTIAMYISDEDTAAFTFSKAVYSLEITFPNGDTFEKIHGKIAVSGQTTRHVDDGD